MTHAWGGSVGITMPRQPFVREVMPGVTSIGGYSGHGVMLSNYCGKLYADLVTGNRSDLDLFRDLNIPAFPGRDAVPAPCFCSSRSAWYALRDKSLKAVPCILLHRTLALLNRLDYKLLRPERDRDFS